MTIPISRENAKRFKMAGRGRNKITMKTAKAIGPAQVLALRTAITNSSGESMRPLGIMAVKMAVTKNNTTLSHISPPRIWSVTVRISCLTPSSVSLMERRASVQNGWGVGALHVGYTAVELNR
jgi:hypothetical protein